MSSPKTIVLLAILLLAMPLQACGRSPTGEPDGEFALTVSPQPLNIGEAGDILILTRPNFISPEMYPAFQEDSEQEFTEQHYETDQDAISKIRSFGDQKSYGLALLSNYAAQTLIEDGLLAELDRGNIPNLNGLSDRFRDLPYDPGNQFCVPVSWSTIGLVYNSAQTPSPDSWEALFTTDPASPVYGRISLLDNPREALAAALLFQGDDVNTTNENQIRRAGELLIQSNASRAGFSGANLADRLTEGEVGLAQGAGSQLGPAVESNANLKFTLPQEGGILQVDNLCVLRSAPPEVKATAERFINFLLQPQQSAALASYNFSASPVQAARELLPSGSFGEEFIYPPATDLVPLHLIEPLGEAEQIYQDLFDQIVSSQ